MQNSKEFYFSFLIDHPHKDDIRSIVFLDSNLFITYSKDKQILFWKRCDELQNKFVENFRINCGSNRMGPSMMVISNHILTICDNQIHVWDSLNPTGKPIQVFKGKSDEISSISSFPSNDQIVIGTYKGYS